MKIIPGGQLWCLIGVLKGLVGIIVSQVGIIELLVGKIGSLIGNVRETEVLSLWDRVLAIIKVGTPNILYINYVMLTVKFIWNL